jgi:uncharacterized protein YvpB
MAGVAVFAGAGAGPPADAAPLPAERPAETDSAAVPWYRQQLSNSCEATALRMVLAARGHRVEDQAVLERIGVDRVHDQAGISGPRAGNPFRAFVGDPNGSQLAGTGFGVYHPPVARVARSYGLAVVEAGQGISPARIREQVSRGHPAIVWVDYLWRHKTARQYRAYDGSLVPYAGPAEHVVVVSRIADGRILVNDPARGQYWVTNAAFEAGYATYGNMAVIIH